ncbi:MAG: phosphoribosyltransferase family protein [Gammaproteobacteria bacterium]|nr:phosphoribosyltransferase family protein [Gammaproteobacteria bacterium]
MIEKVYLSAQQLLEDSFRLGVQIVKSGFQPSFMVAIWRGGVPVGIAVQEMLAYHDMEIDHISIRTSSYTGINDRTVNIRIHGMSYLIKNIRHKDRLLIVDDVFDTGFTIQAVINHLHSKTRQNAPYAIKIAVPYYKPSKNCVDFEPDYYIHETESWLKFPHSLEGLDIDEVRNNRPNLFKIIKHLVPSK